MPKYGTIDPNLNTLDTQELYQQNKQDTQQRQEKFINPQQDFAQTLKIKSKYGTPIEEPIGNMFIPFGGVKPVDENAVQNIEDLQDIPEARAQSQTTGKLIANSLGQTLNELTVGLGYGVAQLFDDDILKTNAGDQNFENAASKYFKDIQDKINEDVFPIYQTHDSEEGNFIDKLGDGTWWASNFPQIASTAQMLIPALGTSSAIRMLGEIGKESRVAKMLAKGLSMDAALAKDAEFVNTLGAIGAAGTSRHIENNMEASQTFQQYYQEALQKGVPDEQAKKLAGEAAARNWKYNLALLSSDVLEYATLLKPFKSFGKIAEGLKASKFAKAIDPLVVPLGEGVEETWQYMSNAEAGEKKPFDKDFYTKRLADYVADPQLQTAAFWGATGGAGMYAAGPLMRKISQASSNLATNKVTAATFGDSEKAKNLDQDTFNSLLSRNYSIDKLDRMQNDMKAFHDDYISKPDITPDEKQEIEDKYKDWTDQVNFVKETDKNALSDPKFQKNPETRKSFVLQQLEAKNLAEDISTNKGIVDSYYSELPSAYNDVKNVNKEVNKLKALKALQKSVKASNFHDIKKDYHLDDIEKQIVVQEAKVNSAKELYKTSTGKEYTKQILPQEFHAINAHSRLERDQFKHDNIIQPELLKYQSDSEENTSVKEQEIVKKQKETNKKAAKEAAKNSNSPLNIVNNTDEETLKDINRDLESISEETPTNDTSEEEYDIPEEDSFQKQNRILGARYANMSPQKVAGDVLRLQKHIDNVLKSDKTLSLEDKQDFEDSINAIKEIKGTNEEVISQLAALKAALESNVKLTNTIDDFFTKDSKRFEGQEHQELDKQAEELSKDGVDSEVEPDIESVLPTYTSNEPVKESNVFHINASQYKVNLIDGKRKVVGDSLPFANNFDWDTINKLPIGSKLVARIDPDKEVYIEGKPYKNSEVKPEQQLVSLFAGDKFVGILYTQNGSQKELFPVWRKEVQEKGSKEFNVVQKYKGDIFTLSPVEGTNIPAARTSLTDIESAQGEKVKLGFIGKTELGLHVETPNLDNVSALVPNTFKGKAGQIVAVLPKGNGEYMFYPLVTKSLYQGEGQDYKNVEFKDNELLKKTLGLLKELQTTQDLENVLKQIHSIIALPILYKANKNGEFYYSFNPEHTKTGSLEAFKALPEKSGITVYQRKDKIGKAQQDVVIVSKELIDSISIGEENYPVGTPQRAFLDYIGNMKLQIQGSELNKDNYYDIVSRRTKTDLNTTPVVNVSFFIQPLADEVKLSQEEVDKLVVRDLNDIVKEEQDKTKNLVEEKENIDKVLNADFIQKTKLREEKISKLKEINPLLAVHFLLSNKGVQNEYGSDTSLLTAILHISFKEADKLVQEHLSKIKPKDWKLGDEYNTSELDSQLNKVLADLDKAVNTPEVETQAIKTPARPKRPNSGKSTKERSESIGTKYEVWDKEKELKWLSEKLPNIPTIVLSDISKLQSGLDVNVYGQFKNSVIYLAENTKTGTAYHEAFHTVTWVGLNKIQRANLFKEARELYGDLSDDLLEEILAEKFIDYVQTDGLVSPEKKSLKSWFSRLYQWVKLNIFQRPEIDYLYYKLNAGKYANLKPNLLLKVNKLSSQFPPIIREDRVNSLVANFSLAIDDFVAAHPEFQNITRTQLLKTVPHEGFKNSIEMFMDDAYNKIYNDWEVAFNIDPNSERTLALNNFLNNILDYDSEGNMVPHELGVKAMYKIAAREGYKVSANKLEAYKPMEDSDVEIDENDTVQEGWQVSFKSMSNQMGLSNEVRKEISYLKDGTQDDLDYPRYLDMDMVHAVLLERMGDLFTRERMIPELKKLTETTHPQLKPIYDKMISEDPKDEPFRIHFVNDFAKTKVEFKTPIQKSDGRMVILSSNGDRMVNKLITNWESNFYASGYINYDGKLNVAKVQEAVSNITSDKEVRGKKIPKSTEEKMELFNSTFNLNIDSRVFPQVSDFILQNLLSDLYKGENIFETNTTKLGIIAKLDAQYKDELIESCFRNSAGNSVFSHLLPGFMAKQISNIKADFNAFLEYYESDTFYVNSPMIQDMKVDKAIIDNLEWCLIDGSKYNGENDGTQYADFSDKQFLSNQLNMFFNNTNQKYGWYQTPILSDSPEGAFVKMPKLTNTEVFTNLFRVFKQEEARIKDPNTYGVKFFDNNPDKSQDNKNKFYFLDLTKADIVEGDNFIKDKIRSTVDKKFIDYWNTLLENNVFDLKDNLGVDKSFIPDYSKKKKEKTTTLSDKDLIEIQKKAYTYFLNQAYASSQIITLTIGDPAMYKSTTDFYKRSKEIISPTLQMDISATYSLTKEEMENEGGKEQVITPGQKYNTLIVNDVKMMGNVAPELFESYEKTKELFYARMAANYGFSNHVNQQGKKFVKAINSEGKDVYFATKDINVADAQTFISPNRYRKIAVGYARWNKQLQDTFGRIVTNKPLIEEDYNVIMNPYKPFYFGHSKIGTKIVPIQNKNSEYMLTPQLVKGSKTLQKVYDLMVNHNLDAFSFESVVKVGLYNNVSWDDIQNGVDVTSKIQQLDNSNYGLQQEIPEHYIDNSALFGTQIMKHIIANLNPEGDYIVDGQKIKGKDLIKEYQNLIIQNLTEDYAKTQEDLGLSTEVIDYKKLSDFLSAEIRSRDLGDDLFEAVQLDADGKFNIHPSDPLHRDRNEKLLTSIYKNRITKQKIKGGAFVQVSGIGFSEELSIVRNADGSVKEVQCILPWSSKKFFKPFMDEKTGYIDITKVPDNLLEMVGYRIPTEDKYSMLPLKVVDFSPSQTGGIVMLPIEITTLSGSDFDVDKLYIMMPEFEVSKDGLDIRKITDLETKQGRNNRIIDIHKAVLTNENTFKQFIKPGGYAELKKPANIVFLAVNKVGDFNDIKTWGEKKLEDAVEALINKQGLDVISPLSNMTMFSRNMTGRKLKGIAANHNASHSMLQHTNTELAKTIIINGESYKSLHEIYNRSGELISNNVSQRLAAYVDNNGDPNAFKVNLNTYTADIDLLLTRLGVPIMESFLFLNQPIVREFVRRYFLYGGDLQAETKVTKELVEEFNIDTPNTSKLDDIDISEQGLVKGLNQELISKGQQIVFKKFLLYKDLSNSLVDLVNSMTSMNNGVGPLMADAEIMLRKQNDIKVDKNLLNVSEIFDGTVYPLFKSFNENGLIKPQKDLQRVFPLSTSDENSVVYQIKNEISKIIPKKNLNSKDINNLNNFILTYIGGKFEFFKSEDKEHYVKEFPLEYKKALEDSNLRDYKISKFIQYRQDDKFPYGRLEFSNSGSLNTILKDDLKDSWFQILNSEDENMRKIGADLIKYTFHKEGVLFGPKTFSHLQPTKFFIETKDGREVNRMWKQTFDAENLGLLNEDKTRIVEQFLKNNWKNASFVPLATTDNSKVFFEDTVPVSVVAITTNKDFYKKGTFVKFIKVAIDTTNEKGYKKTEYVLMKKDKVNYSDQGLEVKAIYTPTNKLGKNSFLVEANSKIDGLQSLLEENNTGFFGDLNIQDMLDEVPDVDNFEDAFEPEEVVSGFQGYKGGFENVGKGTPEGDGKDKAMRQVADGFIGEIVKSKSSSQTSRNYIIDKTNKSDKSTQLPTSGVNIPIKDMTSGGQVIMLARNSEFKGQELLPETQYFIKNAAMSNSEFVVGDMPNVDSQFIDYLQEIGAKFTIYHTGNTPRIQISQSEENVVSLQEESKTLKDILESFELYESMFNELGITKESLSKMSEEDLGKLLNDKIC